MRGSSERAAGARNIFTPVARRPRSARPAQRGRLVALAMSCKFHRLAWIFVAATLMAEAASPQQLPQPSIVAVTQTMREQPGRLFTKLELAANGDARVTFESDDGSKASAGTILLVAGHWMLVRGLTAEPGREIDNLDIAALNSQLVLTLLSRALPDGFPSGGKERVVSFAENSERIEVGTSSASGGYPAPWSVKGKVTSVVDSTVVNYSLDFKYRADEHNDSTIHLEGFIANPSEQLELDDSMSLDGWAVHKIGAFEEHTGDGTTFDYGARTAKVAAKTIGQLRLIK